MSAFDVEYLRFEFGTAWQDTVFKFDEHNDYHRILRLCEGTKGVDLLGLFQGDLYFIEVTDYRSWPPAERTKLQVEISQKIRDSLACIMAAYRTSNNPDLWRPFAEALIDKQRTINVILWLEDDVPSPPPRSARRREKDSYRKQGWHRKGIQREDLRRRLRWLTRNVLVCNLDVDNWTHLDIQVHNLSKGQS